MITPCHISQLPGSLRSSTVGPLIFNKVNFKQIQGEGSGSVVVCLTRDGRAAGSSLTGITALWSLSKTHLS